jgi:hypothetical protein
VKEILIHDLGVQKRCLKMGSTFGRRGSKETLAVITDQAAGTVARAPAI